MEHYLDNAATTKPCAEAAAAVMSCISAHYGNPSSLHRKGLEAQHEVEYARNQIAGALGCKAQEIVFTSGATGKFQSGDPRGGGSIRQKAKENRCQCRRARFCESNLPI